MRYARHRVSGVRRKRNSCYQNSPGTFFFSRTNRSTFSGSRFTCMEGSGIWGFARWGTAVLDNRRVLLASL